MNIKSSTHKFESAGLGVAPFKCVGVFEKFYQASPDSPRQAGGLCDFCGTGIVVHCQIVSADGREFVVGNECVRHTYDATLISEAKVLVNARKRELRHERESARINAAKEKLSDVRVKFALRAEPHPDARRAANGSTMLDMVNWFFANAGNKGKIEVSKIVEAVDADSVDVETAILTMTEIETSLAAAEKARVDENARIEQENAAKREAIAQDNAEIRNILWLKCSGGFGLDMYNRLATEPLSSLSDRQLAIVADIYAKNFGRGGSKAYETAREWVFKKAERVY